MQTISRRTFLTGASLSLLSIPSLAGEATMTAPQAQKAALSKQAVLIDIRHPDEWKQTGIAKSAHPISMHQRGFLEKLDKLIGNDKTKKIALICATGSRSAYVQKELIKRGYTNAISVAEGMLGGPNGKGWIPRGLPIKKVK